MSTTQTSPTDVTFIRYNGAYIHTVPGILKIVCLVCWENYLFFCFSYFFLLCWLQKIEFKLIHVQWFVQKVSYSNVLCAEVSRLDFIDVKIIGEKCYFCCTVNRSMIISLWTSDFCCSRLLSSIYFFRIRRQINNQLPISNCLYKPLN